MKRHLPILLAIGLLCGCTPPEEVGPPPGYVHPVDTLPIATTLLKMVGTRYYQGWHVEKIQNWATNETTIDSTWVPFDSVKTSFVSINFVELKTYNHTAATRKYNHILPLSLKPDSLVNIPNTLHLYADYTTASHWLNEKDYKIEVNMYYDTTTNKIKYDLRQLDDVNPPPTARRYYSTYYTEL